MAYNDIVVMGRVTIPHGVKGWVKIKVFTEAPDNLLDYPVWWLNTQAGWRQYKLNDAEWRESGLVACFEGFDNRTTVETLKGMEVGIPRSELPAPSEGEYYWTDLIGLEVINKQGELFGTVDGLIETGANDVMVVCEESSHSPVPSPGEKPARVERLIPYIETVIVSVDLTSRRIVVDWGLDY
ncbi:MAG: ribosome maturation factor RimM [Pseudomonadota bacterium]